MSVNFDTLLSPGNMYAGDPVPCPKCSAILSHISKAEGEEQKVSSHFLRKATNYKGIIL